MNKCAHSWAYVSSCVFMQNEGTVITIGHELSDDIDGLSLGDHSIEAH